MSSARKGYQCILRIAYKQKYTCTVVRIVYLQPPPPPHLPRLQLGFWVFWYISKRFYFQWRTCDDSYWLGI